MAFSDAFAKGYTVGSQIDNRRRAKQDLEKQNKFNMGVLQDFLGPRLNDDNQQKLSSALEQIQSDPNVSPAAQARMLANLTGTIQNEITQQEVLTQQNALDARDKNIAVDLINRFSEVYPEAGEELRARFDPNVPGAQSLAETKAAIEMYGVTQQALNARAQTEASNQLFKDLTGLRDEPPPSPQDFTPAPVDATASTPVAEDFDTGSAMSPIGLTANTRDELVGTGDSKPNIQANTESPIPIIDKKKLTNVQVRDLFEAAKPLFPDVENLRLTGQNPSFKGKVKFTDMSVGAKGIGKSRNILAPDFVTLPQVVQHVQKTNPELLQNMPIAESSPVQPAAVATPRPPVEPANVPKPPQLSEAEQASNFIKESAPQEAQGKGPASPEALQSAITRYLQTPGATPAGAASVLTTIGQIDAMVNPAPAVGATIPAAELGKMSLRMELSQSMDRLVTAAAADDGKSTGRLNSTLNWVRRNVGVPLSETATELEQAYFGLANSMLRALSGAAVTEQEMQRVLRQIGDLSSADKNFMQKVRALRDEHKGKLQTTFNVFSSAGYNVPSDFYKYATTGMDEETQKNLIKMQQLNEVKENLGK